MEPDVIRMYSSSPPPMEDSVEDEDEEFGDFDTFSGVPSSISLTEFDTPTTFNQSQALSATSPPELLHSRGLLGFSHSSSNGTHTPDNESDGVTPASQQDGCPSERTEMKKILSGCAVSDTASGKPVDCNGGGTEVLTNGFATFDVQESPSSVKPVHSDVDKDSLPVCSTVDSFADFAAFSGAEGHHNHNRNHNHNQTASMDRSTGGSHHCMTDQGLSSEDTVRDTNRTQSNTSSSDSRSGLSEASACENGTDSESLQRFAAGAEEHSASETVCMDSVLTQNGLDVCNETALSPDAAADSEAEQSDGKVSGNETETETETSFGQPLSTDALEEYGEVSTTGSAPSPPLQGDASTPADHSQLAEDEDEEDFGDFGDAGSFCGQGFAGFEQPEDVSATEDDDFGDFNTPRFISSGCEEQDRGRVAEFPVSESFGNFSSAVEGGEGDVGWSAFGDQQQVEGEAWAAFSTEEGGVPHAESRVEEVEEEMEEWHESEASAVSEETDRELMLLSSRLQKLFQMSFPQTSTVTSTEDQVVSLKALLEPGEDKTQPGAEEGTRSPSCHRSAHGDVWTQLQDIHDALGLRYQWGGSHCNKVLLCCLGIDTRNILFTGQKKQPVIVPMYAANLGMLEPTKEPVKPVSAAEMIASIAQTLPPDNSSCPSDSVQEALPPIQFDWSSSGLTNPLDASGGSSLLNLDFFGPVEDSGSSSSTSIPGVDPELYELTTAKLDPGSSGSRVADAFARLMSTMEKTSTSTRKPRKDENLSEEAAKVIAGLPDLTFMQAKVLMFPATLTPLDSQAASD